MPRDTDQGGPFDDPPLTKQVGNADDLEFGLYTLVYGEVLTWITWRLAGNVGYTLRFFSRDAAEEMWKEIEYDFFNKIVNEESVR